MQIKSLCFQVCTKKSNKLELHFRPEDPYSHPAFGELQPCNNFLLKISKKKVKSLINKNNPDGVPEHASAVNLEQNMTFPKLSETSQKIVRSESEPLPDSSEVDVQTQTRAHDPLFADIVAQVSEAYHFNGYADLFFLMFSPSCLAIAAKIHFSVIHCIPSSCCSPKVWWITSMFLLFMLIMLEGKKGIGMEKNHSSVRASFLFLSFQGIRFASILNFSSFNL